MSHESLDDQAFVEQVRDQMLSFARSQLNHEQEAEDVVQEALAGALRNMERFAHRAALRTWIFTILRNKIADTLRKRYRNLESDSYDECNECGDGDDSWFDDSGHWQAQHKPNSWQGTDQQALSDDFWRIFDYCLNHLPAEQGRVFMMREMLELSSADICHNLALSTSNLHVLLHRARLRLRECLSNHWFEGEHHAEL
ncbi:RNA polymerase sigma factor [Bacterioplanes sanyensis]|uniref:sigma-70 family RNA polymerase sigma factor n=1 Tax=Bacterioplanes sanyensis TaxID=1249553 RepID=UPI001679CBEB|nr:sigma-70 family RNA polymerase sigma factor [Bacterioplanes sanyensis]GGY49779.1 RNA polymerase sigma factor [Bacterioplanes sanyensis]